MAQAGPFCESGYFACDPHCDHRKVEKICYHFFEKCGLIKEGRNLIESERV